MSFPRIRVLFTLASFSLASALAAQTTPPTNTAGSNERTTSLVVLRNGEILEGHIQAAKHDRLTVRLPRGEISLRQAEVDVIAATLDDAYALKMAKIPPTDIEGRLDLAAWCVRHKLFGNAASEVATAISIQPRHPRIALVQRRLWQSIEQQQSEQLAHADSSVEPAAPTEQPPNAQHPQFVPSQPVAWPPRKSNSPAVQPNISIDAPSQKAIDPVNASKTAASKRALPRDTITEIERLVRTLPSEAVETFTSVAQPILVNGCATAGCHAPGNSTTFTLLRLPQDRPVSRRLTQRNLYNVVQLVDFKEPAESDLFKLLNEPHGPLKAPALGQTQSVAYRELIRWVATLTRSNLDSMLPAQSLEIEPAIADARLKRDASRQSLMRRLQSPSVKTSRNPGHSAPEANADRAGLAVGAPSQAAPIAADAVEPLSNGFESRNPPSADTPTDVKPVGLIVGVPPTPLSQSQPGTVPQLSQSRVSALQPTAQSAAAAGLPQTAPPRAPSPRGITAVDRFVAFQGVPRVAQEIQAPSKTSSVNSTPTNKQQPTANEPDPYDLMRFVKEK